MSSSRSWTGLVRDGLLTRDRVGRGAASPPGRPLPRILATPGGRRQGVSRSRRGPSSGQLRSYSRRGRRDPARARLRPPTRPSSPTPSRYRRLRTTIRSCGTRLPRSGSSPGTRREPPAPIAGPTLVATCDRGPTPTGSPNHRNGTLGRAHRRGDARPRTARFATRLRRLVSRRSRPAGRTLRPRIQAIVDGLLDASRGRPRIRPHRHGLRRAAAGDRPRRRCWGPRAAHGARLRPWSADMCLMYELDPRPVSSWRGRRSRRASSSATTSGACSPSGGSGPATTSSAPWQRSSTAATP